jgi:trans-aconitate 2-methyltransferase
MSSPGKSWNAELYQSSHAYVWNYGRDLLALLAAKPGERILDLGCGTGQLTSEVAQCGAAMVGVDSSPEMIAGARENFPDLHFELADATALPYQGEFDAVISNAALHWIRDQRSAIASVARALKPGGRFVFEMGGHQNLRETLAAGSEALRSLGVQDPERLIPWFFPSVGEYAPLLEEAGLEVRVALHFARPTPLKHGEQGLARWIEMFGGFAFAAVADDQREELIRRWEGRARPKLFHDGAWTADYQRLRMVAVKPSS